MKDKEIIHQIKSGNSPNYELALKALYKKYFHQIARFVIENSGEMEDAADLFQDTLLALFKNIQRPDFEMKSSLKTYLYAIARNLWLKQLRARRREQELRHWPGGEEVAEDQLQIIYTQEQYAGLAAAVAELPEECRELLRLFYFEEKSMRQIAEMLDIANENVAKNRKSRCMKKLRALIGHWKEE